MLVILPYLVISVILLLTYSTYLRHLTSLLYSLYIRTLVQLQHILDTLLYRQKNEQLHLMVDLSLLQSLKWVK